MIDDQLALRTPEGITLRISPAGPFPRLYAFLIDLLIRAAIYFAGFLIWAFSSARFDGSIFTGIALIALFLMEWFYPVFFELFRNGQTPGKKAMGLTVVHSNGSPITVNGSIIRNLLRNADFLPLMYFSGLISILLSRNFQRLGDLAADTLVVHVSKASQSAPPVQLDDIAPDWPATRQDQITLISFLERGASLTQARRQELASLAWPECPANEAELKALATAKHLVGGS